MALGPVMLDVAGLALDDSDRALLRHPAVGGVILFARNYASREQLCELSAEIHALREPRLLLAVDHEGGRVQRFHHGFTRIPSMARLGELYERSPEQALALAHDGGWLVATELLGCGIDLNFAPVLDLDQRRSRVISERAFGDDPDLVTSLARAWIHGMREAGMCAVGKHFPGHGGVVEDSHDTLPSDARDLETFALRDLLPFERLGSNELAGIMSAHLLVPLVDSLPVTFSRRWLTEVLRSRLGFNGAVFSDDLSMGAALGFGTPGERARAALEAGCDMVLVCNDRPSAEMAVEHVAARRDVISASRLSRLHARRALGAEAASDHPRRRDTARRLCALEPAPQLDLPDDNPA